MHGLIEERPYSKDRLLALHPSITLDRGLHVNFVGRARSPQSFLRR